MSRQFQKLLEKIQAALHASRNADALKLIERALKIDPRHPRLLLRAGILCHQTGLHGEAAHYYRRAITAAPAFGEAHNNLGMLQMEAGHLRDAATSFRTAAQHLPCSPAPLAALSTALQRQNLIPQAIQACRAALERAPDFAEAHHNLAMLLLLQGRFEEGWNEYEWRRRVPGCPAPRCNVPFPLWEGSPLSGKTILLYTEQGFGDAIQFCRYAVTIAAMGANVCLACPSELVSLFETLAGVETVLPFGASLPAPEFQAPLLSLPRILKTDLTTIPSATPYLSPPAGYRDTWSTIVRNDEAYKIGIVWAGRAKPDPARSCTLRELSALGKIPGVSWYSLQVGEGTNEIHRYGDYLSLRDHTGMVADFGDTAALIDQLDLVISIDTAVAHLAGALGKQVWLMLPFAPDWRWMTDRDSSPWYPSMRIFRQKTAGDWTAVIDGIAATLYTMTAPMRMNRVKDEPAA